jgi:single-strand DNA-binding protein
LSKGRQVYVEGRIQTRTYDDKEGNKRYITEIVAQDVQFLGGGGREGGRSEGRQSDPPPPSDGEFASAGYGGGGGGGPDDDIPF